MLLRPDRSRRVGLLIVAIIVLSLADLLLTLACLRTTGLLEANPIAAFLIRETGSVAVLIAFKALSVGICTGLLYHLRRHVEGEAAAWCAVIILVLLCFQWSAYTSWLPTAEDVQLARQFNVGGGEWLRLD